MRIGIYNLHMSTRGGGEKRSLALAAHFSRNHEVFLIVPNRLDLPALEQYFQVDLSHVTVVPLEETYFFVRPLKVFRDPTRLSNELLPRFTTLRQIKRLNLDVFVNSSYGSDMACPVPQGIYMCMFPQKQPSQPRTREIFRASALIRKAKRVAFGFHPAPIDTYSVVTANSNYTRDWIEKLWGCDAVLVYSACDRVSPAPAAKKEKIILSVGRFDFCKRQDALLDAFKNMKDLQHEGWQLHLIGSTGQQASSLSYVAELREKARGQSVFFHFDADIRTLHDLYRRASLYWHATGFGFAADSEKQEHFGMTTVEAMSAGAVPVVIDSGGQREIVEHEVNGLRWQNLAELEKHSRRLIADPNLRQTLAQRAAASTAKFNRAAFNAKMDQVLAQVVSR